MAPDVFDPLFGLVSPLGGRVLMTLALFVGELFALFLLLPFGVEEHARDRQLKDLSRHAARFVVYGFVAVTQVAQHTLSMVYRVELGGGFSLNSGSLLIFPFGLAVVLYLYITRHPTVFRNLFGVIVITNATMAVVSWLPRSGYVTVVSLPDELLSLTGRYAAVYIPNEWKELFTAESTARVAWGTVCTCGDVILLVIIYRWLTAAGWSRRVRIIAPLLAALAFDAACFSLVCALVQQRAYLPNVAVQMVGKLAVGLVFAWVVCRKATAVRPLPRGFRMWPRWAKGWWVLSGFEPARRFLLTAPAPLGIVPADMDAPPTPTDRHDASPLALGPDGLADSGGPGEYAAALKKMVELWDQLIAEHPRRCAAVTAAGLVAVADDTAALHQMLLERGVSTDAVEIRWLLPHMTPRPHNRRVSAA